MSQLQDLRNQKAVLERKIDAMERAEQEERARKLVLSFPAFIPMSAGSYEDKVRLSVEAINTTHLRLKDLSVLSGKSSYIEKDVTEFSSDDRLASAAAALKTALDRHGSDKAAGHNYHHLYAAILADRNAIQSVFEVGLGTNNQDVVSHMGANGKPGASLRAFRDFLPNAQIYGADVDSRILFEEDRIRTFKVDQTIPATFTQLQPELPTEIDLIIDDGLHAPNANLATLAFGLTRVRKGGWVVVEDISPTAKEIWDVAAALLPDGCQSYLVRTNGKALMFAVQKVGG